MNDPLANMLSKINNAEKVAKTDIIVEVYSNTILKVLNVLKDNGYIGDFEEVDNPRRKYLKINLIGKINNCNAIKPRFAVQLENFEKFEKRFLPAKNFGILIISTSKGIMIHHDAKKNSVGGKLLAYCY